jgi:hypothetical protein
MESFISVWDLAFRISWMAGLGFLVISVLMSWWHLAHQS